MNTLHVVLLASPSVILIGIAIGAVRAYGRLSRWQGGVDARLDSGKSVMDRMEQRLGVIEERLRPPAA